MIILSAVSCVWEMPGRPVYGQLQEQQNVSAEISSWMIKDKTVIEWWSIPSLMINLRYLPPWMQRVSNRPFWRFGILTTCTRTRLFWLIWSSRLEQTFFPWTFYFCWKICYYLIGILRHSWKKNHILLIFPQNMWLCNLNQSYQHLIIKCVSLTIKCILTFWSWMLVRCFQNDFDRLSLFMYHKDFLWSNLLYILCFLLEFQSINCLYITFQQI